MIKKELYKTEDGRELFRTFSDTGHKIRKANDGVIYSEALDLSADEVYEEVECYVEIDGVESYEEVLESVKEYEKISGKINRLNLNDNEAMSVKEVYPKWESFIDKTIEKGFITLYDGNLWRARQTHTVLEIYPPNINTASLYEVIVKAHTGDVDDPIPYTPPMEIFNGKYYIQNDIVYRCIKDSGTALVHDLSALVGLYVELA